MNKPGTVCLVSVMFCKECGSRSQILFQLWQQIKRYYPYFNWTMCVLYVIGVLCHFQQSFSHITMVAAFCMRQDSSQVLSAFNTDAPCCRHKPQMHHPVTLSWAFSKETASTNFDAFGLAEGVRTCDLLTARRTLSSLDHRSQFYFMFSTCGLTKSIIW